MTSAPRETAQLDAQSFLDKKHFHVETLANLAARKKERENDILTGKYGFSKPWYAFNDGTIQDIINDSKDKAPEYPEYFFEAVVNKWRESI